MQVIQDQHHRRVLGSQRRRQPQQERMVARSARPGGHPRNGNARPTQCCRDIGPEHLRPVVELIQAEPGNHPGSGRRPQRQGHCLARARRARDNGQRAPPRPLGDQLGDVRTMHRPLRHTRRGDLRCQDRIAAETADRPVRITWSAPSAASVFIATSPVLLSTRHRPASSGPSSVTPRDTGRHHSRLQWKAPPPTTQNASGPGRASCHRD